MSEQDWENEGGAVLPDVAMDRAVQSEAPTAPRTGTGRALLRSDPELRTTILAIEAEARAASQERPRSRYEQINGVTYERGTDGRLHLPGVAQERPQPTSIDAEWSDTVDRYMPSQERPQPDEVGLAYDRGWTAGRESVRTVLEAQERPPIDVALDALRTAINVYDATPVHEIDEETTRGQEGRIILAARSLLDVAGGSVASPEGIGKPRHSGPPYNDEGIPM
jgi:hypothetical protein